MPDLHFKIGTKSPFDIAIEALAKEKIIIASQRPDLDTLKLLAAYLDVDRNRLSRMLGALGIRETVEKNLYA